MAPRFLPALVNDPFDDPGLYIEFMYHNRAILFDLGDISAMPNKKLLKVSDIFISHRHMDHFCGFDYLLRIALARPQTIRLFGFTGLIEAIKHRLAAYSWNLMGNYDEALVLEVADYDGDRLTRARFSAVTGFEQQDLPSQKVSGGVLLKEDSFLVKTAILDHKIPCLAFSLEESSCINIRKNNLENQGLKTGSWLTTFKQQLNSHAPDDTSITVLWQQDTADKPETLPLAHLRETITHKSAGIKLTYVVDIGYTTDNIAKLKQLAHQSDILFSEACFLEIDAHQGQMRYHLTAKEAGQIGALANVKKLVTFHYSPRYEGQGDKVDKEAQDSFLGLA